MSGPMGGTGFAIYQSGFSEEKSPFAQTRYLRIVFNSLSLDLQVEDPDPSGLQNPVSRLPLSLHPLARLTGNALPENVSLLPPNATVSPPGSVKYFL